MIDVSLKEWETSFFGKAIYQLTLSPVTSEAVLAKQLPAILESTPFDLMEVNVNTAQLPLAAPLEDLGFRLVDSRATFLTPIDIRTGAFTFPNPYPEYVIDRAAPEDHSAIMTLTERFVIDNPNLISRYKNTRYFASGTDRRYFRRWIAYCLEKESTYVAVSRIGGVPVGFFIFEDRGEFEGLPLFKGILAAVDTPHQGKKLHLAMQSFLFEQFATEVFYLDNTTQLSNYPILKNHVRSNRRLHRLSLTFMLDRNDFN